MVAAEQDQDVEVAGLLGRLGGPALDATSQLVLLLDAERRVVACNPVARRLLDCTSGQIAGRRLAELLPEADRDRLLSEIEHAIADVAAQQERLPADRWPDAGFLEVQLRAGPGRFVPLSLSVAPLDDPALPGGAVAIGRDVSTRRRVQRDLDVLADSFRGLAELSGLGLYRLQLRPEPRFVELNGALTAMLGVDPATVNAEQQQLAARLPREVVRQLQASREHPEAGRWPLESTWQHPDGGELEIQITEVPQVDDHGEVVAVTGLVRDLTLQRREQAALAEALRLEQEAADQLRRVDELRRVFLQAVSHELRTPLTSVLGFTATLRNHLDRLPPERAYEIIERAHGQAGRIHNLLDDLLDVDRLSRGVVDLARAEVALPVVIEQGLAQAGLDAELELAPLTAVVDAAKLERVVVNLVGNARRYAGSDAQVLVVLEPGEEGWVRLRVEDDGPGVPEALRDRVFDPFEQGPSAAEAASPGTGIGLTLVAEFVRLHGGHVVIGDSELGGASFVVELPVDGGG